MTCRLFFMIPFLALSLAACDDAEGDSSGEGGETGERETSSGGDSSTESEPGDEGECMCSWEGPVKVEFSEASSFDDRVELVSTITWSPCCESARTEDTILVVSLSDGVVTETTELASGGTSLELEGSELVVPIDPDGQLVLDLDAFDSVLSCTVAIGTLDSDGTTEPLEVSVDLEDYEPSCFGQ